MDTLITTDIWLWVVCPKFFTFGLNMYKHTLLAHFCIIHFTKQSDVGMGGHKTLLSRRGVNFLGKGLKDLPGKWKLHDLNYIHITLKLCKIYAYIYQCQYINLPYIPMF